MKTMPEYTDGVLDLYQIEEDTSEDFPLEYLKNTGMRIWYRELSVYDTTRAKLSADSIEVTMKISIPRYKGINSKMRDIRSRYKHGYGWLEESACKCIWRRKVHETGSF